MLFRGAHKTRIGRHDVVALFLLIPLVALFLPLGVVIGARPSTVPVTELPFEGSEENGESLAQLVAAVQRRAPGARRFDLSASEAVSIRGRPAAAHLANGPVLRKSFFLRLAAKDEVPLFLQKRAFLL